MSVPVPRRALARAGVAIGSLIALVAPAEAGDLRVLAGFSQTFEADSNIQLDPDSPGGVFGSRTDLNLTLEGAGKRTTYDIFGGVGLRGFVGPGDDGTLDSIDPIVRASFDHAGKRFGLTGDLSFSARPTSLAQAEDTGASDSSTQLDASVNLGFIRDIDSTNRLSIDGFATIRDFTDGSTSLTPTRSYGARGGWSRDMSENVAATLSFGATRFTSDNLTDTGTLSFDLRGDVDVDVHERLSFKAGIGASFNRTGRTFSGSRRHENNIGGLGVLGLSYAGERTALDLTLDQSLDQDSDGVVNNLTSLNFGVRHEIDSRSAFLFTTGASYRRALSNLDSTVGDGDRVFFSLSPAYSYEFARDWEARVGYTLRLRDDDSGTGISNAVFFSISHDTVLLP